MSFRRGNFAAVDRASAQKPEIPGRASWDLQPAHWSSGSLVVHFSSDPGTEVVCFAPPGTPLHDEHGLGVAFWRRGVWRTEAEFVAKRAPMAIDRFTFAEAIRETPGDFTKWANSETASHVEMLRAFAQRRPHRKDLQQAATRLSEELETIEPEARERCRIEADLAAARSDLLTFGAVEGPVKTIEPTTFSWGILRRFPGQALLMLALYGLYRLVRPEGTANSFVIPLDQLSPEAVFDVLMWVYGNVHVPLSFLFLAWVFFRWNGAFDFLRNAVIATAVVSVIPYLFISGSAYSLDPSQDVPSSAVPTMPALHLAIGIMVGLWGVLLCRSVSARLLWLAYPILALGVVVASKPNNLLLTISGAIAAVFVGLIVAQMLDSFTTRRRNRSAGRPQGAGRPRVTAIRLPRLPVLPHF